MMVFTYWTSSEYTSDLISLIFYGFLKILIFSEKVKTKGNIQGNVFE